MNPRSARRADHDARPLLISIASHFAGPTVDSNAQQFGGVTRYRSASLSALSPITCTATSSRLRCLTHRRLNRPMSVRKYDKTSCSAATDAEIIEGHSVFHPSDAAILAF